jgi:hypothetical protein
MKKSTLVSRLTLIIGILIALLGLVHSGSTSLAIERYAFDAIGDDKMPALMFFFISTGAALIFSGILNIYASVHIMKDMPWSVNLLLGNSIFLLILGIMAVVLISSNPFAYILLALPLAQIILITSNRQYLPLKSKTQEE